MITAGSMAPTPPPDLARAFDPNGPKRIYAFVGSGPSNDAGLPNWKELLEHIARAADLYDKVAPALQSGRLLDVAHYLARKTSEEAVARRVVHEIKTFMPDEPSDLHRLIVKIPFDGIITTNYDFLLSEADEKNRFDPPTTSVPPDLNAPFIFHMHGSMNDYGKIVLTKSGYDHFALGEARQEVQFLNNIFQNNVVLFIGFGFRDANIESILRDMKDLGVTDGWSMFGLVPKLKHEAHDEVFHEALMHRNVRPVYIEHPEEDEHGVEALKAWLGALGRAADRLKKSCAHPVSRANPPKPLDDITDVLRATEYNPLIQDALDSLPDRPDLKDSTKRLIGGRGAPKLYGWLDEQETRVLLRHLYENRPSSALRDILSCFPPAPTLISD